MGKDANYDVGVSGETMGFITPRKWVFSSEPKCMVVGGGLAGLS